MFFTNSNYLFLYHKLLKNKANIFSIITKTLRTMKSIKQINATIKSNEVVETTKTFSIKGGARGTGTKCTTCTSTYTLPIIK